jgi:hypothetical protein
MEATGVLTNCDLNKSYRGVIPDGVEVSVKCHVVT